MAAEGGLGCLLLGRCPGRAGPRRALLFRTVAMVLFSPFLGYMSEEVERREAGREPAPFTWRGAGADALRGSLLALATTALSLFALVLCFALEAIPLVGTVGGLVLAPVFQGFFAGMNFFDPPLERRRLRHVGESLRFLWRSRWRLVANGLVFLALLAIPVVGWFLAPGYAALAGTIGSLRRLREDRGRLA
ncbi:MAG: EI24 domain-containing protein [Verrucomicrobiales bacterium]